MPEYTTPELVLGRLRLPDTDPDAPFVASCTTAANLLVDNWLDRDVDDLGRWPPLVAPYPDPVVIAATNVAVKLYRGKDATADVADTWDAQLVIREPRDPITPEVPKLAPWRAPRGWAPA